MLDQPRRFRACQNLDTIGIIDKTFRRFPSPQDAITCKKLRYMLLVSNYRLLAVQCREKAFRLSSLHRNFAQMEFAFKKGLITPNLEYGRSALSTRACSTLVGCHFVGGVMLRHPACVANFVGCPRPKRAHVMSSMSWLKGACVSGSLQADMVNIVGYIRYFDPACILSIATSTSNFGLGM